MLSSAICRGSRRTAGVDVNKINHADIPGFKSQGAIGLGGYQKLLDFGHRSHLDALQTLVSNWFNCRLLCLTFTRLFFL